MKLYVIPIERNCNGKCPFCITRFRDYKNHLLKTDRLREVLENNEFEKIEITGGGEPSVHPKIFEIIKLCKSYAPTQIYTNGSLNFDSKQNELTKICLSRAHYNDSENQRIMGIKYDIRKYKGLPVKLSLMIHKSGISTEAEVLKYVEWAKNRSDSIVIRQLFKYQEPGYIAFYNEEFVPTAELFKNLKGSRLENGNRSLKIKNVEVEIEERTCSCESQNPVLHADSVLAEGWE